MEPREALAALRARYHGLREAAALPGADTRLILDSALAELDAAIEAAAAANGQGPADGQAAAAPAPDPPPGLQAERRLLRAVFQEAPVPLLLLGQDGIVRRANRSAGAALGSGTGYATGKPFTTFVDPRFRAAVRSQLAAVARTGKPRTVRCDMLTAEGSRTCDLTVALAQPRSQAGQLVVALSKQDRGPSAAAASGSPGAEPGKETAGGEEAAPAQPVVAAMTRRLDLVIAVTRLLLENATGNEAVTLQRCAGLLADDFASWVIVDTAGGHRPRRQFVLGPEDEESAALARAATALDPAPSSVPGTVCATGGSQLIAYCDDADGLGPGPDGLPLMTALGATSALSVPIAEAGHAYGALTLARRPNKPPFTLADLALVEELGRQLALAITMDREVRRHTDMAAALRESLLLRELPDIPGARVAMSHTPAAESPEVGGDFCDVFQAGGGWGLAIGDVSGRGIDGAAASAAARHAIRVVGRSGANPAAVLADVNQYLLTGESGGKFVTACLAYAQWHGGRLRVVLSSAGHPPPVVLRADGRAERAKGGGVPLGIFPDVGAEAETILLRRGDTLVCFTDGLTDARALPAGYFGDRLTGEIAALAGQAPDEILSGLHERALGFSHGEIRDDITMLAIQARTPPGADEG